ncbi:uncharacterized protein LOC117332809 [Pecten maximus]|uniref:uncharacterized protein LOC117332809 n=1 Tax=Pecten maximus TaxID=6579 RepID=UPI001457EB2A|nr:uncharacterized protein LOC117332809 [Pecten maximus]
MSIDTENPAVSLGRFMGNILGHIQVKIGDALRCGESDESGRCQKATGFQKLFEAEWNYRVNSVCVKRKNALHRQKVQTIPLTEDLKTLTEFIMCNIRETSTALQKCPTPCDWTKLAKFTMCRLILFNKRRRAEVKDLKVQDYEKRPNWHEDQRGEFDLALSHADKVLASRMDMVISAGKSRKNVDAYVLLPPDSKDAIDLLNSLRDKVGIRSTNEYIFARVCSETPLTGNTELREIVDSCPNLQHPDRISSTSLRKYIATVSQILDMTDPELEMLATHLGHDVKTHKENYRLSHSTRELTKTQLCSFTISELPTVEDILHGEDGVDEEGTLSNRRQESDEEGTLSYRRQESDEEGLDGSSSIVQSEPHKRSTGENNKHAKKRAWTQEENDCLKKKFKFYFAGVKSVHNADMVDAQKLCPSLCLRTKAQIRAKLNNMKLGKST